MKQTFEQYCNETMSQNKLDDSVFVVGKRVWVYTRGGVKRDRSHTPDRFAGKFTIAKKTAKTIVTVNGDRFSIAKLEQGEYRKFINCYYLPAEKKK